MSKKPIQQYENDEARVTYDPSLCIHAAECISSLPSVFDIERRPWIDVDGAEPNEIEATVKRCPSGALQFARRQDDAQSVAAVAVNTIRVSADGPLLAQGDLKVVDMENETLSDEPKLALCRCGASKNKPFCDGSHKQIQFSDVAHVRAKPKADESTGSGTLEIKTVVDGPLLLSGAHRLIGSDGTEAENQSRNALCRCGHSENKPYCDGSHKKIQFKT